MVGMNARTFAMVVGILVTCVSCGYVQTYQVDIRIQDILYSIPDVRTDSGPFVRHLSAVTPFLLLYLLGLTAVATFSSLIRQFVAIT